MTTTAERASHPALISAAAPDRSFISMRGLSKRFQVRKRWQDIIRHPFARQWVNGLSDVSCEIGEGEFFGLLGPNGAGKTTLLKILSTFVLPDEGTATVAGYDVVHQAREVHRLLVPAVADERSLNWRLSARENLNLFAVLYGLGGARLRHRVEEVLASVELSDTGEKMVGQFSSGMKQRLLIARALLPRPAVLLLDEPTRSMDPISARRFREFLCDELIRRQRCTVILATHSSEEALELCDRIGILHRGRLLAVGPAESLAREFAGERYRLWTRDPTHPALRAVGAIIGIPDGSDRESDSDNGWVPVQIELHGGMERAAELVAGLVRAGVPVARCERVKLPLADLIEQVVRRSDEGAFHA